MLKPQTSVTGASSLVNLSTNSNLSASLSKSSENVSTCEFEVINALCIPKSNAPPIPKHNVVKTANAIDGIDDNLKRINFSSATDTCEKVIVGPAETITGIIDTRPLEARKPIITNSSTTTSTNCGNTDSKESILVSPNGANNLYHLKVSSSQQQQPPQSQQQQQLQNQFRHQSYPNHFSAQSSLNSANQHQFMASAPSKSQTTPHLGLEYVKLCTTTSSTSSSSSSASSASTNAPSGDQHRDYGLASRNNATNANNGTSNNSSSATSNGSNRNATAATPAPLLYENITLNTKDCNVPYENINLEYIARLMNEGYSKENVITALGISRNNIEMACDILHEFVSKSGA